MKAQLNLYLNQSTIELLREKAHAVTANVGDLADLCIRFAFERMPEDALRKWVASQTSTKGRLRGALTKDQRCVVDAFERIAKRPENEGAWRFSHENVAREAGLRPAVAYWTLKQLQTRGLTTGTDGEELDRWGRPLKSFWSLISAMPDRELERLGLKRAA
jgi:hypothetical protein